VNAEIGLLYNSSVFLLHVQFAAHFYWRPAWDGDKDVVFAWGRRESGRLRGLPVGMEVSIVGIPLGWEQISREFLENGRNTCGIPADMNYET